MYGRDRACSWDLGFGLKVGMGLMGRDKGRDRA
jgi:hypothetical protein